MKIGTFTWPSARSSRSSARAGSLRATRLICSQLRNASCRAFVSSALIVTRYIARPSADVPAASMVMRPPLSAAIASSVQPIA